MINGIIKFTWKHRWTVHGRGVYNCYFIRVSKIPERITTNRVINFHQPFDDVRGIEGRRRISFGSLRLIVGLGPSARRNRCLLDSVGENSQKLSVYPR